MQDQQIVIPRDEMRRATRDGQFQELVVLRITTVLNRIVDENDFDRGEEFIKGSRSISGTQVTVKLSPDQNCAQFLNRFLRGQQSPQQIGRPHGPIRNRSREHRCTDNDVRVEDDP